MKRVDKPADRTKDPVNARIPADDPIKEQRPQGRREIGGPPGPEPTRYGDWEKGGRCIDF